MNYISYININGNFICTEFLPALSWNTRISIDQKGYHVSSIFGEEPAIISEKRLIEPEFHRIIKIENINNL